MWGMAAASLTQFGGGTQGREQKVVQSRHLTHVCWINAQKGSVSLMLHWHGSCTEQGRSPSVSMYSGPYSVSGTLSVLSKYSLNERHEPARVAIPSLLPLNKS